MNIEKQLKTAEELLIELKSKRTDANLLLDRQQRKLEESIVYLASSLEALKLVNKTVVCKKHKRNIGGAAARKGLCENCQTTTHTGGGALPKLCDECSKNLQECKYCRDKNVPKS